MTRSRVALIWAGCVCLVGGVLWRLFPVPSTPQQVTAQTPQWAPEQAVITEPIQPIPVRVTLDQRKVALGQRLFHDPQLSHDNTLACASCHDLRKGGTDRRARSIGINGALGEVNAPTVYNAAFNFKQFWDGRAETLEEQAAGPLHNPKEMGASWPEVIAKLTQDPGYVQTFKKLYPDGISAASIADAIAAFERSLITPNARFDRFLRGDQEALTAEEREGYRLFKDLGCVVCHQGVNIGGNMFQTMGKMADYFANRGNIATADFGRYNVTGDERDRYKFKVPTLRNIALTAPYFHDATAQTLEEAIQTMAKYQLGVSLTAREVELLVAYLNTLTGEYEGKPLEAP
ncbi:MAG: cytochrome-c peroxidase [Candidatus Omnitrophica bacterium]|nr:cytochrome-c peroxidase [Candidatus Omnitrophota bacterium]